MQQLLVWCHFWIPNEALIDWRLILIWRTSKIWSWIDCQRFFSRSCEGMYVMFYENVSPKLPSKLRGNMSQPVLRGFFPALRNVIVISCYGIEYDVSSISTSSLHIDYRSVLPVCHGDECFNTQNIFCFLDSGHQYEYRESDSNWSRTFLSAGERFRSRVHSMHNWKSTSNLQKGINERILPRHLFFIDPSSCL